MGKQKVNSKTLGQQKRKRRRVITFVRMLRYGANNFSRNAWLTIAATAVMTITLLIVFVTLSARQILTDTVDNIRTKVDMSIYVKSSTGEEDAAKIAEQLRGLSSVRSVAYVTPSAARAEYIEANKKNPRILKALNESITEFPGTFRVNIEDINDTSELQAFVDKNELFKQYADTTREPSFAGPLRSAIENIGRWISFAEKAGIIASAVFIVISSLIVFNTIRMAIFNRKEEIQMMKLIGADKSFIRGPFLVEAIVYGFIAALIATGLGVAGLYGVKDKLSVYGVHIQPTIDAVTLYVPFVLLGMIVLGALIGMISSYFATRRYLKIS